MKVRPSPTDVLLQLADGLQFDSLDSLVSAAELPFYIHGLCDPVV
jgi:hypothetical protein